MTKIYNSKPYDLEEIKFQSAADIKTKRQIQGLSKNEHTRLKEQAQKPEPTKRDTVIGRNQHEHGAPTAVAERRDGV